MHTSPSGHHPRLLGMGLALWGLGAQANNLTLSNVSVSPRDGATATVAFDIAWDHSWRFATVNHDAAWVFFKAQAQGGTTWTNHVVLSGSGTNPEGFSTGTGSSLELIVPPDGMGLFVRRAADGSGAIAAQGVKAVFDLAASGLTTTDAVKLQAMAIEMVYVAEGNFKVGSGSTTDVGSFTDGSWTTGAPIPLAITSEAELTIAQTVGNLWGTSSTGTGTIGGTGTLLAEFPKGYAGFYCMKYEVTEGQWVDFFNTLTSAQKTARDITQGPTAEQQGKNADTVLNRNTVSWTSGDATTTAPDRSCSYLNWNDMCAYADWAGLRPMTELEFEKACRGPSVPASAELPWGNTTVSATTALVNDGTGTDTATGGNANYSSCTPDGPYRAGIYATATSTRQQAGASYWGILDLGGSLWDRFVSVGHADGRAFTGAHGDGALTATGYADASDWPAAAAAYGGNNTANGAGARGGSWLAGGVAVRMQVSDRNGAVDGYNYRTRQHGFRAVRTAPFSGAVAQEEVTGSTDRFKGGPYDGWGSSVALDYASLAVPGTLVLLR